MNLIEDITFEKMDEEEAVALDKSNYGNNGFLKGGARVVDTHSSCRHGVQIPPGGDIIFDGSIMRDHPRSAITIATWLRLDRKVDGVHSIFDTVGSHSNHNLGQFHFEVVGGDVRWFHRNETGDEVFSAITGKDSFSLFLFYTPTFSLYYFIAFTSNHCLLLKRPGLKKGQISGTR